MASQVLTRFEKLNTKYASTALSPPRPSPCPRNAILKPFPAASVKARATKEIECRPRPFLVRGFRKRWSSTIRSQLRECRANLPASTLWYSILERSIRTRGKFPGLLRIFGADRRNQSAARSAAKGVPGTLAATNERPSAARSAGHPMVLRTIARLPPNRLVVPSIAALAQH